MYQLNLLGLVKYHSFEIRSCKCSCSAVLRCMLGTSICLTFAQAVCRGRGCDRQTDNAAEDDEMSGGRETSAVCVCMA